ncbi:hypothetical protein BDV95DRAFT_606962 [Massariosphaeria phaeospora]|uniref:Uncharacterized protein n=1 Tax=Massariosphaeria phaeospora TaxID=100035 RepID=A0A7C8MNX1_9PLEO|nr:hypothetical protein BDV95DRAFT_606962 [Massariosphaeria phaeospora]
MADWAPFQRVRTPDFTVGSKDKLLETGIYPVGLQDSPSDIDPSGFLFVHQDGQVEGGLHPPEFYKYPPLEELTGGTWEDGLQVIADFDWGTGTTLEHKTDSSSWEDGLQAIEEFDWNPQPPNSTQETQENEGLRQDSLNAAEATETENTPCSEIDATQTPVNSSIPQQLVEVEVEDTIMGDLPVESPAEEGQPAAIVSDHGLSEEEDDQGDGPDLVSTTIEDVVEANEMNVLVDPALAYSEEAQDFENHPTQTELQPIADHKERETAHPSPDVDEDLGLDEQFVHTDSRLSTRDDDQEDLHEGAAVIHSPHNVHQLPHRFRTDFQDPNTDDTGQNSSVPCENGSSNGGIATRSSSVAISDVSEAAQTPGHLPLGTGNALHPHAPEQIPTEDVDVEAGEEVSLESRHPASPIAEPLRTTSDTPTGLETGYRTIVTELVEAAAAAESESTPSHHEPDEAMSSLSQQNKHDDSAETNEHSFPGDLLDEQLEISEHLALPPSPWTKHPLKSTTATENDSQELSDVPSQLSSQDVPTGVAKLTSEQPSGHDTTNETLQDQELVVSKASGTTTPAVVGDDEEDHLPDKCEDEKGAEDIADTAVSEPLMQDKPEEPKTPRLSAPTGSSTPQSNTPRLKLYNKRKRGQPLKTKTPSSSRKKDKNFKPDSSESDYFKPAPKRPKKITPKTRSKGLTAGELKPTATSIKEHAMSTPENSKMAQNDQDEDDDGEEEKTDDGDAPTATGDNISASEARSKPADPMRVGIRELSSLASTHNTSTFFSTLSTPLGKTPSRLKNMVVKASKPKGTSTPQSPRQQSQSSSDFAEDAIVKSHPLYPGYGKRTTRSDIRPGTSSTNSYANVDVDEDEDEYEQDDVDGEGGDDDEVNDTSTPRALRTRTGTGKGPFSSTTKTKPKAKPKLKPRGRPKATPPPTKRTTTTTKATPRPNPLTRGSASTPTFTPTPPADQPNKFGFRLPRGSKARKSDSNDAATTSTTPNSAPTQKRQARRQSGVANDEGDGDGDGEAHDGAEAAATQKRQTRRQSAQAQEELEELEKEKNIGKRLRSGGAKGP